MAKFNISNSTIGQLSDSGDNVQTHAEAPGRKTIWDRLFKGYWIIGITVSIISGTIAWYVAHVTHGIWFFGLK